MDWTACSRETERDYTWDNAHASSSLASFARDTLAPAFERSLTTSRFAALLRRHGSRDGVLLGVSVSTKRVDFSHRPIRTMAFLRAENPDEEKLLAAFFAECLRKSDVETLYAAESGVAKAVESLYQTKKTDEFLAFCKSLNPVDGTGGAPENRWAVPRNDGAERKSLADALPAAIAGDSPFLFALTDCLPSDVLASLGSMFDRGTIRIFSKATSRKERIPEPPQKYGRAATIGGAILLFAILGAVLETCSFGGTGKRSHSGLVVESRESRQTNVVDRPIESAVVGTNASSRVGIGPANAVPTEGRSVEPIREIRQDGVSTNAATASAKTAAAVTNNPAESSAIRNGETK